MKTIRIILAISLIMTGCRADRTTSNPSDESDAFLTVDVTASYPQKELVLQDFMDIEYIPFDSGDKFLFHGDVCAMGKEIIVVTNYSAEIVYGDIYLFDRKGKGLRTINRMGQGSQEYLRITGITLDEENEELFVNDHSSKKIMVFDMQGNFKRGIKHRENSRYMKVYNFDKDKLICHDNYYVKEGEVDNFVIISKQDGSIIHDIVIPFEKKVNRYLFETKSNKGEIMMAVAKTPNYYPVIPYYDSWVITEPSSDTIFALSPDYVMKPFIVRTPSVLSMEPEVLLFPGILSDRYFFMQIIRKVYDFKSQTGFPRNNIAYDRQEKTLFEYILRIDGYPIPDMDMMQATGNDEIAFSCKIEAFKLIEAYKKGELKGRLKEIAAELDDEDNPVLMLVKNKK